MRESSPTITRMYWQRSGAVDAGSFSTASAKPTLLSIGET